MRTLIVAAIGLCLATSASAFKLGIIAFQMSAETHARCSNSAAEAAKKALKKTVSDNALSGLTL